MRDRWFLLGLAAAAMLTVAGCARDRSMSTAAAAAAPTAASSVMIDGVKYPTVTDVEAKSLSEYMGYRNDWTGEYYGPRKAVSSLSPQ